MNKILKKGIIILLIALLFILKVFPNQSYAAAKNKINKGSVKLLVSKSINLSVNGKKSGLKWKSSNVLVARVTSKGKVTGKKPGKAIITAQIGAKTYKCKVTVKIGLNKTKVDLKTGDTTKIKLCGTKIKKAKSSNKKVATVNKKGKIKAVGVGNATITIKGKNNKKYKCKVTVSKPSVSSSAINKDNKTKDESNKTKYYQVTFDSNGGNAIPSQKVLSGKRANAPEPPTREGYSFDQWEYNGKAFDFSSPITSDITLIAKWSVDEETWENAKEVLQVIEVEEALDIPTENQVIETMEERGFEDNSIVYDFTNTGDYCDKTEVEPGSTEQRPVYLTEYLSKSGEVWTVYDINGALFAYPASFNLESELEAEVLVSETDEITSYDSETNRYYVTIPDRAGAIVKVVDRIDAETLDSLTADVLSKL